jgi:hypothetical protein
MMTLLEEETRGNWGLSEEVEVGVCGLRNYRLDSTGVDRRSRALTTEWDCSFVRFICSGYLENIFNFRRATQGLILARAALLIFQSRGQWWLLGICCCLPMAEVTVARSYLRS